ncbi:Trehalose-phosphatase [Sphaceloma murrayae]|uniref:Trehalose-phosphatase n=1 Tax=Sphaceloma murrayae TaxID=2082308 RepID=A0A2K1R092_9PEZI|nr:Trehalose-phosphatase [Sphaceloma murrayae]
MASEQAQNGRSNDSQSSQQGSTDECTTDTSSPESSSAHECDSTSGTPLERHLSTDSTTSFDTTPLSPSLSFLGLDDIEPTIKPRADLNKPFLKIKPGDHPDLHLSGRIISATFCLPHKLTFTHEEADPWTFEHRPGTAALFESLRFLSSPQTAWKHFVIGWTGEIVHRRARKDMTPQMYLLEKYPPVSKQSTPIPTDGGPRFPQVHDPDLNIKRADRVKLEQRLMSDSGMSMIPVWLTDSIDEEKDIFTFQDQFKWRNYTEKELYQLFHYKLPVVIAGEEKSKRWDEYMRLNKMFADRILEFYSPGDTVIVHDYQLLLVPDLLRSRVRDIKIALVLHTPFPSHEYFRCLTHRDAIMAGILGADTIFFQSLNFADQFRQCCVQLAGQCKASLTEVDTPDNRSVTLEVLQLGMDNDAVRKFAFESPLVQDLVQKHGRMYHGKRATIIGRDRVDSTRGVKQKLQAFATLLTLHPIWRNRIELIQILTPPSIEDVGRGGKANVGELVRETEAINAKFGNFGWRPIILLTESPKKEEYFAALRLAEIALITSIREGMSTMAIEFALLQRDRHKPVVISEFSGSASALPGAIFVNPFDARQTANTIHAALLTNKRERKVMYDQTNAALTANNLPLYTHKMLRRLYINMELHKVEEVRPELDYDIIKRYSTNASKRLFVFDYDGTLTPIVNDPGHALPSTDMLQVLTNLAEDERNTVWIISGRDQAFLSRYLGHISQLGFSAEHGCFMRYPRSTTWQDMTVNKDKGWQAVVQDVLQKVADSMPGTVVEQKQVSITWHYRRAANPNAAAYAKVLKKRLLRSVAVTYDIEIMAGKANLEVRPKTINKGQVVRKLLKEFGSGPENEPDFVLCVGDDTTDEDMFRALRRSELPMTNVFAVLVGGSHRTTLASWRVDEPANVIDLVGLLNEANRDAVPMTKPPPKPRTLPSSQRTPWYKTAPF